MMKCTLRERVGWPGLDADVTDFLKDCIDCTVISSEDRPEPMTRKILPNGPWQELAIDFLEVRERKVYFWVVVDYYSRYVMVKTTTTTSADATITKLEEVFRIWSYPKSIIADNGPPFNGAAFASYCAAKGVKHVKSIPY